MHAISSYHGTTHTHTPTNRQDRLQYTASQLVRSVIIQKSGPNKQHKKNTKTIAKRARQSLV